MKKIALLFAFFACAPFLNAQTPTVDSPDADSSEAVRVYTLKELARIARSTADTINTGERRRFLSFSFGNSTAVGRFRKSENRSLGDGFAQTGFAFQMEYASFWNRNIGFGFSGGTFANKVDERRASAFFPAAQTGNPNAPRTITDLKPWRTYHLFMGPYLTFPFENLSLDFKFLGGFVLNRHPGGISTINGDVFSSTETVPLSNTALGYNFGTSLRLKLSRGTQLKVGVDYMHAFPQASYAFGQSTNTRTDTGRQNISVLNFSWGLAIDVGKRK